MIRKNQIFDVTIDALSPLGYGVGKIEEEADREDGGKVVFVNGAVPGERVRASAIKVTKNYLVARLLETVTPSCLRASEDLCSAPISCGGCTYRAVSYAYELKSKRDYIQNCFSREGLSDVKIEEVQGNERISGYRNKAQYPIAPGKNGIEIGFYAAKSHRIVSASACALQPAVFSEIAAFLKEFADAHALPAYDEISGSGLLRHLYLRKGEGTGEILVTLVVTDFEFSARDRLAKELTEAFPAVVGLLLNRQTRKTNVVLSDDYLLLRGREILTDTLLGLTFEIAPSAFWQVNHDGAEQLYLLAKEHAALCGNETLLDLYCGIGSIGLTMARDARRLVGVEILPAAVECAKRNAERNGIGNADFFVGDASTAESFFAASGIGKAGGANGENLVVILDPPRKGTTRELIDCIADAKAERVVYVSCGPDTLARDCAYFRERGYRIGPVTPYNLFPRTAHCECVVCLTRSESHTMQLNAQPFSMIRSGKKTIELRLYDEKRRKLATGDRIVFTNRENGEQMTAEICAIHRFESFEELYRTLPLDRCGYTEETAAAASHTDMEAYYSPEEQKEYGVVGIELRVIG